MYIEICTNLYINNEYSDILHLLCASYQNIELVALYNDSNKVQYL